jgi:transcription elongation factor Elf1
MPTNPLTYHTNIRPCGCELQMLTRYEQEFDNHVMQSQVLVYTAIAANNNFAILTTKFCQAHAHLNIQQNTPMADVYRILNEYDAANEVIE